MRPCSIAQSSPAAKIVPLPRLSGPSTRTEMMSAAGRQAVDDPGAGRPVTDDIDRVGVVDDDGSSSPGSTRTLRTSLPPTAGWSRSTPESMIATVTPAAVGATEGPLAVESRERDEALEPARPSPTNGSLHAGRYSSVTGRSSAAAARVDRVAAARRARPAGRSRQADRSRARAGRDRRRGPGDLVDEAPRAGCRLRDPRSRYAGPDELVRAASLVAPCLRLDAQRGPEQRSECRARRGWPGWRSPPGARRPTASSMSRRQNAASLALVEHLEDADRALVVDQRDRDDRPRHVAGLLGQGPPEARVARRRRRARAPDPS